MTESISISIGEGFRIFKRPDGRSRFWNIAYYLRGKEHRESLKTDDEQKARDKANRIKNRIEAGKDDSSITYMLPTQRSVKVSKLLDNLAEQFKVNGQLSAQNASQIKRVKRDFAGWKALELKSSDITEYINRRLDEGAAKATINRTTQILGQAYRLADLTPPKITHLSEKGNVRRGFFSEPEIRKVIQNLPDDLKDFTLFAYLVGMRKGEIASLEWADLDGDVLTLRGEDAKNGLARSIPIIGELVEVIERRRAARQFKVKETITLSNLIFHRDGLPIREFRKSWATACKLASVDGRLFHDLRRSAVRDMIRSGVSQAVAKSISGHVTDSMFSRYNITDDRDQREALLMRQQYLKTVKDKVAAMPIR